MRNIDKIINARRSNPHYDQELWDVIAQLNGRTLQNVENEALQRRLAQIDRNIQYLEETSGPRDELGPERGWISPWYWFRLRHWTMSEFEERGVEPRTPIDYAPMPKLKSEFLGIHNGGEKRLARISRVPWLMDALLKGNLRFAPATNYRLIEDDEARTDNEMEKHYRRPGNFLRMTSQDGKRLEPIGDVTFATRRAIADGKIEIPYWLISYSTDFDPRLFSDFSSKEGDDAILMIFEPMEFIKRALPYLNKAAPFSEKRLDQIEYYDAYHPPATKLSPLSMKDLRFAYQREFRLSLDPGGREVLANGEAFFVNIGSIEDIAAVYAKDGSLIAGNGPASFLV